MYTLVSLSYACDGHVMFFLSSNGNFFLYITSGITKLILNKVVNYRTMKFYRRNYSLLNKNTNLPLMLQFLASSTEEVNYGGH